MTIQRSRYLIPALFIVYFLIGFVYIQRTAILMGDEFIYTLWDDAMISMRYAANLSQSHGLVWNPGEQPVQGITNLGVTLVMALVHLLPISAPETSWVMQLINLVLLLAIMVFVWEITSNLCPDSKVAPRAAVLGMFLSAPTAIWALQGSDTAFVTLWLLYPIFVLSKIDRSGEKYPVSLWAWIALGSVIRPDCLLYVGVFFLAGFAYSSGRFLRQSVAILLPGLVLISMLLVSYFYYGDALPNTYYLKSTGTPQKLMLLHGLEQVVQWHGLLLACAISALAVYRFRHRMVILQMGAMVLLTVLYTIKVGGDWAVANGIRYIVPIIPLLVILVCVACTSFHEERRAQPESLFALRPLVSGVIAVVIAVSISPRASLSEWFNWNTETMYYPYNEQNVKYGFYFRDFVTTDTTIAVHWAGVSPYFSQRPAFDVLGKSDPHIAAMTVERFAPGHSKWDWSYTLAQHPDVFINVSRGLDQMADFRSQYYQFRGASGFEYYVRKNSLHKIKETAYMLRDMQTGKIVRSVPAA